jgi:Type VI secretion system/phage-baseplate injector OB domain
MNAGTADRALDAAEYDADRFYGKYRGLVIDTADPLGRGRLRALVPDVLGTETSGWALPCAPYTGPNAGLHAIPPAGAGVWIEFEAGDPSRPIWVGGWWADGQVPTDQTSTPSTSERKILRSDQGLLVSLDDGARTIAISDSGGTNLITIQVNAGRIEMTGAARAVVEAPVILHGAGAQHPAVFGDLLLAYLNQLVALFNAHVHAGETVAGVLAVTPAPPVAPFPAATASLISNKNLVE